MSYTTFTQSKNDIDRDPQNVPIYTGHSLFNTTKRITLMFIVQSLLHSNLPYIWIKIIEIAIQIECLHRTKFLDPDSYQDCNLNLDNKLGIIGKEKFNPNFHIHCFIINWYSNSLGNNFHEHSIWIQISVKMGLLRGGQKVYVNE